MDVDYCVMSHTAPKDSGGYGGIEIISGVWAYPFGTDESCAISAIQRGYIPGICWLQRFPPGAFRRFIL